MFGRLAGRKLDRVGMFGRLAGRKFQTDGAIRPNERSSTDFKFV